MSDRWQRQRWHCLHFKAPQNIQMCHWMDNNLDYTRMTIQVHGYFNLSSVPVRREFYDQNLLTNKIAFICLKRTSSSDKLSFQLNWNMFDMRRLCWFYYLIIQLQIVGNRQQIWGFQFLEVLVRMISFVLIYCGRSNFGSFFYGILWQKCKDWW